MANEDFRLDIALELTPASLKAIQSDINNTIRQINPELTLDLSQIEKFARDGLQAIPLSIGSIEKSSVLEIKQQIENLLDIRINKLTPTARAKKDLKAQLDAAALELEVAVKARDANDRAAFVGDYRSSGRFESAADVTPGASTEEKNKAVAEASDKYRKALSALTDVVEEERKIIEAGNQENIKAFQAKVKEAQARLEQAEAIKLETQAIAESRSARARSLLIERRRINEARDSGQEKKANALLLRFNQKEAEEAAAIKKQAAEEELDAVRLLGTFNQKEADQRAKLDSDANALLRRHNQVESDLIAKKQKQADDLKKKQDEQDAQDELDANKLLGRFNQAEADARQAAVDALNKVRAERVKEAELIKKENDAQDAKDQQEDVNANKLLARYKQEEARILNQSILEALAANRKINEVNQRIQSARESLVSSIQNQVKVGNLKPKDTSSAQGSQGLFKKSLEGATTGFNILTNVVPTISDALKRARDRVDSEFSQLKLSGTKKEVEALKKQLANQTKKVADASKELDLQEKSLATPDKKIAARDALLKEVGEHRYIQRQINSKTREISKIESGIEKAKRDSLTNERANAAASARDAKTIASTKNLKGLQGVGKILESAQERIASEFSNFKLSGAKKAVEDLKKAINAQKDKVREAAKELELQKKALSTPDKKIAARDALFKELGEHRLIQRKLNEKAREVVKIEGEIARAKKDRLAHERALAAVTAREAKRGSSTRGGGSQGSRDFTFRGVGDITKFGKQLDSKSLEKFVDVLQDSGNKTKTAAQLQSTFATSIKQSNGLVSKIRDNLNSGTRAAFQFGEQTTDAARRLLAWAGPATFIFSTISALKQATKQLTEIDQAARRLTFFESFKGENLTESSSVGAINIDFGGFNSKIVEAEKNVRLFIDTSRDMGIALEDVVEATLTASRVGQDLTQTVRDQNGGLKEAPSQFLDTVLSLVRLEGGALKAEDAVNSLNAIDIQFFSKLKGDLEGADLEQFSEQLKTGLAAAGSLLAVVAAKSAFSVRELADATARVGAAFANIQGTGLPQVIALIGEASSATGANVGRLSTALRQVLTFSVQNSEAIKKSFNIDVIDAQGGVAGFEAVLKVLRKINELSGTEKAVDLAKLIGDRRNVADIQSLAVAVAALEKQFGNLSDTQTEARIVQFAVEQQLLQNIVAADSTQAAMNRLNTEFVDLANNAGLGSFFKELVNGATSFVQLMNTAIGTVEKFKPLLAGVAAFSLAKVAPKIGAGIAGFVGKTLVNTTKEEAATAIQTEANLLKAANAARKDGLLTQSQLNGVQRQLLPLIQKEAELKLLVTKAETLHSIELAKRIPNTQRIIALETKINSLKLQQGVIEKKNALLRNQTQNQVLATSFGSQLGSTSKLAGVGAAATIAVALFSDKIAEGVSKDKTIQKSVSGAMESAVAGATLGASIGSLIPGIGTLVGGAVGTIAGVGLSAYNSFVNDIQADIDQKTAQIDARRKGLLAKIAQERIAERRKALEAGGKDQRVTLQEEVNKLSAKGLEIAKKFENTELSTEEIQALEREGLANEEELNRANLALKEEELKIEKQKLAIVAQINAIRRDEQRLMVELTNAEKLLGAFASERGKVGINLKFNKAKMEKEIDSLAARAKILFEKRELTAKLGGTFTELAEISQEIADINEEINNKRRSVFGEEAAAQEQILNLASQNAQKQISAWQEASNAVVDAFAKTADLQTQAANGFFDRGKAFTDALGQKLGEISSLLVDAGASIAERLSKTRDIQAKRLNTIQGAAGAALSRLNAGAVTPFGSTAELRATAERVATLIGEAGKRGTQEVFNEESKLINKRLATLRTEADNSKTLFDLRLAQTRQEIEIRKKLASEEISILRERQETERALNKERIGQQEEFGSLILEGPQAFLEVAKDIGAARNFFKGIESLDPSSLEKLAGRARTARESGNTSGLNSVLKGLEALQKFGKPSLVSGSSNSQLESIFKRIQGESTDSISKDLKRQRDELNAQTILQQQIEFRERQQQALLEAEAALTDAQLRVQVAAQDAAIHQRDAMIALMNEAVKEQVDARAELVRLQTILLGSLVYNAQGQAEPVIKAIQEFAQAASKERNAVGDKVVGESVGLNGITDSGKSLADALARAANGASGFANEIVGLGDLQDRMAEALNAKFNPTAAVNRAGSPTVSGTGGVEAINRIEELVRRTTTGGVSIGRSKEFKELEAIIARTGGSEEQRREFARLKAEDVRPRTFGSNQSGDVARTLLKDGQIRSGLEDGFRGLLQSGAGGDTDLVRQLREARGSDVRGARNIDPERVKEILGRSGLSGVGRDIDTRAEAVQVVDRLLKFSEELNKTPDKLSERATDILRDILAAELKTGFREIADVLQARADPVSREEAAAANAASTRLNIFNENDLTAFGDKFARIITENTETAMATIIGDISDKVGEAIVSSIKNNTIRVDLPALQVALSGEVKSILNGEGFLQEFAEILTNAGIDKQQVINLTNRVAEMARVMVDKDMIPADLTGPPAGR